jgi:hypothetical protein
MKDGDGCCDAAASSFVPKVWGEVFLHSHAVAEKRQVVCRIECSACQDLFVKNSLDVNEMMSMLLTLLFAYLAFSVSVNIDFPCTAHIFFPEHLSSHYQGLLRTFFEICTKLMLFLYRIHREISSGQMHDSKQKNVKISTST